MPRFTVTVGEESTNVKVDNAREAIDRAVEKIWGKGHSFQVSSYQYYTNPESAALHGTILRAAKGGGGHVITRTSVFVKRI